MNDKWKPVSDELMRWAEEGRTARIWLRDDDAIEPTPQLDTFLEITEKFDVPVMLAIIPEPVKASLADRLLRSRNITPVVHGWGHVNHAPKGEKSQELGAHRPQQTVMTELSNGLKKLGALFNTGLLPVLVPPWNRIDSNLIPKLPEIGYRAISAFGRKPLDRPVEKLTVINTHVDLIDWKGTRGCRNHGELVSEIANELAESRNGDDRAIGLLTHHLVHDVAVNNFLQEFFEMVRADPSAEWVSASDLI